MIYTYTDIKSPILYWDISEKEFIDQKGSVIIELYLKDTCIKINSYLMHIWILLQQNIKIKEGFGFHEKKAQIILSFRHHGVKDFLFIVFLGLLQHHDLQ